jgi:hypothetical protein
MTGRFRTPVTAAVAVLVGLLGAFVVAGFDSTAGGPAGVVASKTAAAGPNSAAAVHACLSRGSKIIIAISGSQPVGHAPPVGLAPVTAAQSAAAAVLVVRRAGGAGPVSGPLSGGPSGRAPPSVSGF